MQIIGPILVLSEQPVVAALVGILVELTGQPVFPLAGERHVDALQRVRPLAVVLVDIEVEDIQSDIFFAAAARRRVGVAVFGPERKARTIAEVAGRRSVPWFIVPPEKDQLAAALGAAAGGSRFIRGGDRRQSPEAAITTDGTTILRDAEGRRWMVYDRRGGSRRRAAAGDNRGERVFVSETGVELTCGLADTDWVHNTAVDLELQLVRAMRE